GRLAAEHDGCKTDAAELLIEERKLHLAITLAAEIGCEVTGPQPHLLHLGLQRADGLLIGLGFHPAHADTDMRQRFNFVFDELLDPVELLLILRVGLKIPRHRCLPFVILMRQTELSASSEAASKEKDTAFSKTWRRALTPNCRAFAGERWRALSLRVQLKGNVMGKPETVGLSSKRLATLDRVMKERYVDSGLLGGIQTQVWRRGEL